MADTKIEWADAVWNPIAGCSVVSPGCTNCYAMAMAARVERMGGAPHYAGLTRQTKAGAVWTGRVAVAPDETLTAPLRWKKPKRIFVNSMSDLFHEGVPDEVIDRVFAVMALSPQHTFLVLTKRSERMRSYLAVLERHVIDRLGPRLTTAVNEVFRMSGRSWGKCGSTSTHVTTSGHGSGAMEPEMLRATEDGGIERLGFSVAGEERWFRCAQVYADSIFAAHGRETYEYPRRYGWALKEWPLPNVWLGVSAEDQPRFNERVAHLIDTPAAVRWISAEPLLGPIDLTQLPMYRVADPSSEFPFDTLRARPKSFRIAPGFPYVQPLDWVVAGGESGPKARPMHLDWFRGLHDQCVAAGIPFFGKQLGPTVVMSRSDCATPVALGAGWRAHHAGAPEGTVSLRDRRGADPIEWPPELRRREFPREPAHA